MSERVEALSTEEMQAISIAKQKAISAATQAERFVAEAKVAELEHRSLVQHIFLKNGLNIACRIDETSGIVTWPDEEPQEQKQEG